MDSVSLTAEEDEVIMVRSKHREKTIEEWSLSLLGRFHTTELINFRAAENHLRSVWKMEGNDLKITDVGDGLFRFKFSMENQLKWVINNGPWSFDNHILLLRRWEKGMTAFSVNFQTVPMWVQVWGLPFDLIYKEAGIDIGQGIGRVIEVDCKAIASGEARFLRVRVEVPLDKPIRGGAAVLSPEGDKVWVAFKYERLSGLCFHCGLLGHEAKACEFTKLKVWEESPYGEWLRATEDVPPQTSDSLVLAQSHRDGNPNTNNEDTREEALFFLESHNFHLDSAVSTFLDIDGAETGPQQNFSSGHGHSRTIIEEGIPEIMEVVECLELNAIPALQNYMLGKSFSASELIKWLKQKLDCFDPKLLLSQGYRWLCDAFRLPLTDLKSLVASLASDKAVWDAILRNELVREFQWTPYAVNYVRTLISNEEPGLATGTLMWIWDGEKAKFELIKKFLSLVKGLFQQMEQKIRSSSPLSFVNLLIEAVAQALPARITMA
ncbi:uncharacterized protein LOC115986612 isoform X5 [Quercus lobata]|uniref:uncharacterized protein LOC115984290 isoform X4 n=1 Tax=Quercus lobata TaxID=97700 RepID=UPI00124497E0|nr:uncharacterized protein LOC115984290 isoform X4 [Quercus lobata]XP_030965674.1 uncharacterized protein LOC115986612 isoform X5 [Quercus lobata]